jgi:hypothetical protein
MERLGNLTESQNPALPQLVCDAQFSLTLPKKSREFHKMVILSTPELSPYLSQGWVS